jgi:hypothetical protein
LGRLSLEERVESVPLVLRLGRLDRDPEDERSDLLNDLRML